MNARHFHPSEYGTEYRGGTDPAYDSFVRAVLDDPDDRAGRCAFADWLADHGRHVESLAQRLWTVDPTWEVFQDLTAEKVAVLKPRLTPEMLGRIREAIPFCQAPFFVNPDLAVLQAMEDWPWPFGVDFREADAGRLVRRLPQLPNLQALVTFATLSARQFEAIAAHAPLRRLELCFHPVNADALARLARLPHLEYLKVNGEQFAGADLGVLAGLPALWHLMIHKGKEVPLQGLEQLPALTSLEVAGATLAREADEFLPRLRRLEELEYHARGGPATLTCIARMERLERLGFWFCAGIRQSFTQLAPLTGLKMLSLNGMNVSDEAVDTFSTFSGLHTLVLASRALTDRGVAHLRKLANLRDLELRRAQLSYRGLDFLAGCPGLHRLVLDDSTVISTALRAVEELANLRVLNLSHTGATDPGMSSVARLSRLHALDLAYTAVGNAGLEQLSGLEGLTRLVLYNTRVTGQGLKALHPLRRLRFVALGRRRGGTGRTATALRAALPFVRVTPVGG
jgi:uncharacterized protein (TIGR02996 family)